MQKRSLVIIFLIVTAFLLGMLVANKNSNDATEQLESEENKELGTEEDYFDITDVGASDGGDAEMLEGSAGLYTVRHQNDIYTFESVSFIFSDAQANSPDSGFEGMPAQTELRMQINNFNRNGRSIKLASFRLGTYQGQCSEVEEIPFDLHYGQPLAFVQCWWAGQGSQIAVSLNGKNIYAYTRQIAEEDTSYEPLTEIFKTNISTLVQ